MEKYLLLCDWGNSSFRLGLYNQAEEKIVAEIQSAEGVSVIYRNWQNSKVATSREDVFRQILSRQIAVIAGNTGTLLTNTPVLISGMASSSIGMADLPYADIPFNLNGSQVKTKVFPAEPGFPHDITLVSGVKGKQEVMRGEETQLIGIWALLAKEKKMPGEAVFIFPGTHSKHIYTSNQQVVHFRSFMTGELYQLLGQHSILKDSIAMDETADLSPGNSEAFIDGVKQAASAGLLNTLFTVRTNQLFNRWDKKSNAFYLSGLLIGSELQELKQAHAHSLFLCSGKHLYTLYKTALEELGLMKQATIISAETVATAAMSGQKIIYTTMKSKANE